MKKIMTLMLGLALVMGTTASAFAADEKGAKKEGKKKGKKGEKKEEKH
ncbi:MAG: hypothetical protein SGI92_10270 [Bryobacteraceae bacterium]|nr:hypothetical protein [Bryobacteraceae bacterium]